MKEFLRQIRATSWPILLAMLGLMAVGLLALRTSAAADPAIREHFFKQMVFCCVGLGAFLAATLVPYHRVGRLAYAMFALTLPLLVMLVVAKIARTELGGLLPRRNGAWRWIHLGIFDIQPSEIAKLTFIIMLAWYLRLRDNYRTLRGLVVPFVLTFVPMGLILLEPDLGTSLLLLPTLYAMLFLAGARLKHLLGIVAVATVLLFLPVPHKLSPALDTDEKLDRRSLAYMTIASGDGEYLLSAAPLAVMEQHQVSRVVGWLRQDDPRVIQGKGYQLHKSKLALAAGGWSGGETDPVGDAPADEADAAELLPMLLPLLPDDHTDFIFSVVGGRWGLAGCLALLGLYGVIFVFGAEIAVVTRDPFGRMLAVGVLGLLLAQIFINVGMATGLLPVTGMTLPLVSYGGSSLVVNCAALGLLVNVGQHRPISLARSPFEFGRRREKALAREAMTR
jgi:cell division protein FtsW (lipid II flippase)